MGMKGKRRTPASKKLGVSKDKTGRVEVRRAPTLRTDRLRVYGKHKPSVMLRVHIDFANLVRKDAAKRKLSTTMVTQQIAKGEWP